MSIKSPKQSYIKIRIIKMVVIDSFAHGEEKEKSDVIL